MPSPAVFTARTGPVARWVQARAETSSTQTPVSPAVAVSVALPAREVNARARSASGTGRGYGIFSPRNAPSAAVTSSAPSAHPKTTPRRVTAAPRSCGHPASIVATGAPSRARTSTPDPRSWPGSARETRTCPSNGTAGPRCGVRSMVPSSTTAPSSSRPRSSRTTVPSGRGTAVTAVSLKTPADASPATAPTVRTAAR